MNKIDFNIINFESIDSTSTYLKKSYLQLDNLTLAFADYQSLGHGRMKREWVSPKGDSLLFSILFKEKDIIKNFPSLSLMSASIIHSFLSQYVEGVSIKWPNDVYVNGKKICGILLESVSMGEEIDVVVLGIGININIKDFPNELKDKATSLYLETNKIFNIDDLKNELLKHLSLLVAMMRENDKSYLNTIRKYNYLKNKLVKVYINGLEEEALALDINDDNTLLVDFNNEKISISIGEIICLV